MTKDERTDRQYLLDIVDAIDSVTDFLKDKNKSEFEDSYLLQSAVIRQFEIIGEAASRITDSTRAKIAGLNWSDIIGMRHKMIHDYFEVNIAVTWDTAKNDLTDLKDQIQKMLQIA